jgi:hypothetical protein
MPHSLLCGRGRRLIELLSCHLEMWWRSTAKLAGGEGDLGSRPPWVVVFALTMGEASSGFRPEHLR